MLRCLLKIETELKDICNDVLEILSKHLIPSALGGESKVFYYKMLVLSTVEHSALRSTDNTIVFDHMTCYGNDCTCS